MPVVSRAAGAAVGLVLPSTAQCGPQQWSGTLGIAAGRKERGKEHVS